MAAARASASSSKSAAKKSGSTSSTKGRGTKKAATDKTASTKATTKKPAAKKSATKKPAAKKTTAKKAPAKKTAAKKTAAKKTTAKKTPAKTTAKKAPAKKTPAKKTTAKKTSAPTKKSSAASKRTPNPSESPVKLPKYLTDKKWLDSQRELLISERKSYTHSAEALAAEAASLMADREPGDVQFDEESGEGDTLAVERDRDLALSAKAREKVEEIDAALARLDAGTYGICVVSGEPIPKERLEALPMASKTVSAQTAMF